ncbi:MAG: D-alanyl-D-alanine carboxypeptidase family protein [Candidatus Faecousia sp.]|nr:D-alanyl-D-alanine carboxypeptidase [Clostridiales bacterium]MDY6180941.1 D-alanyl-D-alanine carboxypeptidase family protein [Candidatus Faecousia sp.]
MKRFFAGTAAALLAAVLILPREARAVCAEKALSLDAVSGRVLFDKNADSRSLIASTTKIMTALIVCEQCNVLDRMRIPKEAVGIEGSSMYLREGEVLTIQELLFGLMLSSGNDAAVALAIYCGGTVEGFVELMNDKARLLGLRNTHFENPNGLDSPGHYSTARDLAVLAAYAMENPVFCKTVSAKTVTVGDRYLRNHNKLLWMVEGADGVKTGFTRAAGRALVSSATRDGRRIIAVTLNDPNDWQEHQALLEEGFARFHVQRVVTAGDRIGELEVEGGDGGRVEILAAEHFVYALAPEENPQVALPGPGFVYAPVAEGADAGFAYVLIQGKAVGKFPVVYGRTVELEREEPESLWEKLFGRKAHEGTTAENTVRQGGGLPAEQ